MTEYLGKDAGFVSEREKIVETNPAEMPAEIRRVDSSGSRTLITPPPAEPLGTVVPVSSLAEPAAPMGASVSGPATGAAVARAPEQEKVALFPANEANDLRARWDTIQVGFVDEPRKAVEQANALVSETMKRLTEIFDGERQNLEKQWDRSEGISTEDLRVALRRYRSFFARLLAI